MARYPDVFDEPAALPLMARIRDEGVLTDADWERVLALLESAIVIRVRARQHTGGAIDIDADPRNADWPRISSACRLSGHDLPGWAALWLRWIGRDRDEHAYGGRIGRIAASMGAKRFADRPSGRA